MQVIPEGQACEALQPARHVVPLQRKPAGQRPWEPEHGVPTMPLVGCVHEPEVEQISPMEQPAAGLHDAPQVPLEQCSPRSHSASVAHAFPQSEP
jgi:hypothetical protein